MKKILSTILLLCLASVLSFDAAAQLPEVQLKDLRGRTVNAAQLGNDGKPFVVSFFATWCKPCMRELKAIAEVYPDWQDETGVKMYVISIDDAQNLSKVRPLVDSEGWEYEVLLDTNNDLFRALGIQAVPHVLVFDGEGRMIMNHSGYTDGAESEIIETIRKSQSR